MDDNWKKWITIGKLGDTWKIWVIIGKMGHPWEKWAALKNLGYLWKNGWQLEERSYFEKWVTIGIQGQTWKNGWQLEKRVTLKEMGYTWRILSHLKKGVTLGKNGSQLNKWGTLGKMGHSWKLGYTWKNGLHLEKMGHSWKWVTIGKKVILGKVGHTSKIGSQLEKWVTLGQNGQQLGTLGKMGRTWTKRGQLLDLIYWMVTKRCLLKDWSSLREVSTDPHSTDYPTDYSADHPIHCATRTTMFNRGSILVKSFCRVSSWNTSLLRNYHRTNLLLRFHSSGSYLLVGLENVNAI